MDKTNIPEKFHQYIGEFGVVAFDPKSKEPVGWGFPVVGEKMGEELWNEFQALGEVNFDFKAKTWSLVTKKLTDDEAVAKYGPITNVEYGPRGGWKSITFGSTTFTSKLFKR